MASSANGRHPMGCRGHLRRGSPQCGRRSLFPRISFPGPAQDVFSGAECSARTDSHLRNGISHRKIRNSDYAPAASALPTGLASTPLHRAFSTLLVGVFAVIHTTTTRTLVKVA